MRLKISEFCARQAPPIKMIDLAEALGVDEATVYAWNAGCQFPRPIARLRLTEFFKCKYSDLLEE